MKLNLIVALSVLALVALSCGTIPAITQAVQPTYTLYPTQVPPTQIPPTPIAIPVRTSLDTILVNNGYSRWVEGDQYCDHKCKSWLYPAQGLLAQSYPDGSVTLGITVSDQYDASTSGTIIGHVMQDAFGDDVRLWVANHIANTADADQNGYVDGYQIAMTVDFSGDAPLLIIVIKSPPSSGV